MSASRLVIIITFLYGLNSRVDAATTTATLTSAVQISATCLTPTATSLQFNSYNPASATALTATSTINVFCTLTTPFTVSLNIGTGGGSFASRLMSNGSNTLSYNLYTTSGYTTIWGDGTSSTGTVSSTGSGILTAQPLTVYGRIPIHQYSTAVSYSSTIIATVTY